MAGVVRKEVLSTLPRIQWDPLVDSLETLIINTFFRAFRELISGVNSN